MSALVLSMYGLHDLGERLKAAAAAKRPGMADDDDRFDHDSAVAEAMDLIADEIISYCKDQDA